MTLAEIHYDNIAIVLGFIVGLVLVVLALRPVGRFLARKMSGWDALAQSFPASLIQKTGESYKASGYIGGYQGNIRQYLIEPAAEGLLVTASFAPDSPVLIPWTCIREVSSINLGVLASDVFVQVEYAKPLGFHLPLAALASLQKYLPAERFNSAAPGVEGIVDLVKNRSNRR